MFLHYRKAPVQLTAAELKDLEDKDVGLRILRLRLHNSWKKLEHNVVFAFWNFAVGCFKFFWEMAWGTLIVLCWLLVLVALWWTADESVILVVEAVDIAVSAILAVIKVLAHAASAAANGAGGFIDHALSATHVDSNNPVPSVSITIYGPEYYLGAWWVTFSSIPKVCKSMNTWQKVLSVVIRSWISPSLCPAVRHTYPVTWAYTLMYGLFSWAIFGPEPYENMTPPQNCEAGVDAVLCAWFGFWRVFWSLVIPGYIIYRLLEAFGPFIGDVLGFAWYLPRTVFLWLDWVFDEWEDHEEHERILLESEHRERVQEMSKLPGIEQVAHAIAAG
jgi:hypothetical protein